MMFRAKNVPSEMKTGPTALLLANSMKIWNSTCNKFLAVRAHDPKHAQLVKQIIQQWQFYGAAFGMVERVNGPSLNRPSVLSDEHRFWKIQKRCFWNACACSTCEASHKVRVCKGCWRVLYCNARCQRM